MIITKLSALQISAVLETGEEIRVHGWTYGDEYSDMPVITRVAQNDLFLLGVGANTARVYYRTHPMNPECQLRLDNQDRFQVCQEGPTTDSNSDD